MKKRNKVELTINLANQLPSDINKHTKTVLLIYFNIIAFLWFKKNNIYSAKKVAHVIDFVAIKLESDYTSLDIS